MPKKVRGRWENEPWDGGRVWRELDGTRIFYIRKQIAGVRYEINTRATSETGAVEQLKRFQADPAAYSPQGSEQRAPIWLDEKVTKAFLDWSKARGNTAKWQGQQRLYLAWWSEKLRNVDLRRCSLRDHIIPALAKATSKPQRIAVLKVLFAWLRKERRSISVAEDPTLDTLTVPQNRPEQLRRAKAVPKAHLALAIEHLASDRWRDLLRVLGATGMHVSELERFARDGSVEDLPRDGRTEGAAGVVVIPSTKAGEPLRVAVSAEARKAAERVLEAGSFDRQKFAKALKAACLAAKIPPFGAGRMRHSVATWAVNAGADVRSVSDFLGHKSPRTTRRFYATLATPLKVPTLL